MNETRLITPSNCPTCLSSNTVFLQFRGELIITNKSEPAKGIKILAEVHKCESCSIEFEKIDGPWIGLEMAAWVEAMKYGLEFEKVLDYTTHLRNNMRCKE